MAGQLLGGRKAVIEEERLARGGLPPVGDLDQAGDGNVFEFEAEPVGERRNVPQDVAEFFAQLLLGVLKGVAVPQALLVHGRDGPGLAEQAQERDDDRVCARCRRLVGLEGCLLVLAEVHQWLLSGYPTCLSGIQTLVCPKSRRDRRINRQG